MQVEILQSEFSDDRLYIDGDLICEDLRQIKKFIKFLEYSGYRKTEETKLHDSSIVTWEK